jgi:hypothetical protein
LVGDVGPQSRGDVETVEVLEVARSGDDVMPAPGKLGGGGARPMPWEAPVIRTDDICVLQSVRRWPPAPSRSRRRSTKRSGGPQRRGSVRWFFVHSAEAMEERELDAGCPVALVALERTDDDDEVARYSRERRADWQERFAKGLADDGIARPTARRLATAIINQYEGALILSRVGREIEPLQAAGAVMHQLVAEAH